MLASDPAREAHWRVILKETPFVLDSQARVLTLNAILAVCAHRQWIAHAVHVRTNHVHAVITAEARPERILSDFKAYCTRTLRSKILDLERRRYWTEHGSTRYLWNQVSVRAAVAYVLDGQGARMARYPD
jgi:REP element-mobilizing transposase RayT